jgi:hypothetical protein
MVVSDKYKYVFIELPRTGSTAINKELRENYEGYQILYKHATYSDFEAIATKEQKKYFVFSGVRNPLDDAVSLYFKLKTNHREQFSNMAENKRLITQIVMYPTIRRFKYIQRYNPDFSTYFLKFYKLPFSNWSMVAHEKFDAVLRFENLQEDFDQVLHAIGIEPKRPLPVINKTGKKRDSLSLYNPKAIERAKKVFGPFMQAWGYEFPPEWGDPTIPWLSQVEFKVFNGLKKFYWQYFRAYVHTWLHPERANKWQKIQKRTEA